MPKNALLGVPDHQHRKRQDRLKNQIEWLDRRSNKPKGYQAMLKATSESPLGQLWLSLCHADGQVNCLTHDTTVPVVDRERLLLVHFRLRLKGYTADAVAKICPISLINTDAKTLTDVRDALPEVDPASQAQADLHDLDSQTTDPERLRLQLILGL